LHLAATSGNIAALTYLIKNVPNLNLNSQTIGGETALHKSIIFCKPECLSNLLNAGADPTLLTAEGESIYSLADRC
jgi:ankyrin repeat protein